MKRLVLCFACLLASLFFANAPAAFADGGGPVRKMTPAEAAADKQVRETLREALPKAPAGYTLAFALSDDGDEGLLPEGIQPGQMYQELYTARYTRDESVLAQAQQSNLMDQIKGTPEQQARLAELNAKEADLLKARDNTRDRAEKDKIRSELKEVRAQGNKLQEEIAAVVQDRVNSGAAAQSMEDVDKSLPAKELTIRILVNGDTHLPDKAAPYKIEGIPLAFEQAEGCADFDTYCITLFLGSFETVKKVSGYTGYNLRAADLGVPTKARGFVLTFSGPKDRPDAVRDFVRRADLAKLKALLP
jgi:hypothetical protein